MDALHGLIESLERRVKALELAVESGEKSIKILSQEEKDIAKKDGYCPFVDSLKD